MAENAGAIVYTVDMDTAAVTKGADRVNSALDSVGKGAVRLDGSMGKAETAVRDMGQASTKAAGNVDKLDKATDKASSAAGGFATKLTPLAAAIGGLIAAQTLVDMGKMAEQFTLLQARITRLTADAATAASSYQQLLTVAAATGQTMPDTVRLWESLTGALKSLGASNNEVLALTETLQKIGKLGGSSAEETANAMRQLSQAFASGKLQAEEYNSIIDQTPELIRQMAAATGRSMGEFRQAMLDGKITAQEMFDAIQQRSAAVDAEFKKLPRSVGDAANAITVQMGAALSTIDQALGASQKLAKALDAIARGIQMTFNPTDQEKFNKLLQDRSQAESVYQAQLQNGSRRSQEASKRRLDALNAEIQAMQDARIAAIKAQNGGNSAPTDAPAAVNPDAAKTLDKLREQNALLQKQGEERAVLQALQQANVAADSAEGQAIAKVAAENFRLAEAEKARATAASQGAAASKKAAQETAAAVQQAANEAQRAYEANQTVIEGLAVQLAQATLKGEELAIAQAKARLNQFATPEDVAEVERLTRALVAQQQAVANTQLAGRVDPFIGAQQAFDKQMVDIQTLEQAQILSTQRANELRLQSETAYQEQVRMLQEETFRQASVGNDLLIGTLNQLQQAGTQAFVGLITGANNGRQAVQALAASLLNEAVGALVQMGVQYVKNLVIGESAAAAAAATGVATAGVLATAYATPAALASLASFGANAAPASAGIASTVGLAQGLAIGARQYGGPVAAGSMYRVNEGGAPEIFNAAGGKQYMMPNTRGEVVSNKDATMGAQAPINIQVVNNSANAQVRTEMREDEQGRFVSFFIDDIDSGGPMYQAMAGRTNMTRVGE